MNTDSNNKTNSLKAFYNLHPKLCEILDEDLTTSEIYVCKLCKTNGNKHFKGQMKNLVGHLESATHKKIIKDDKLNDILIASIKDYRQPSKSAQKIADADTVTVELQRRPITVIARRQPKKSRSNTELLFSITKFMIENRLPNLIANKLLTFMQSTIQSFEPLTIEDASISKTTAAIIIKDCISATMKADLLKSLSESPYSLLLDESTDAFGASFLAICARYISEKNLKHPVTKLISIVQLGESQTGETLFQMLQKKVRNGLRTQDTSGDRLHQESLCS